MRLRILGSLSVTTGANAEVPLPGGRGRVLLAALAVRANRIVSVDELAELIWDGDPPPKAVKAIRVYMTRLRQVLGQEVAAHIVTRDPGYVLSVGSDDLDLLEFENLYRAGGDALRRRDWTAAADLLSVAVRLWRGTPLLDVPSDALRVAELPRLELLHLQAVEGRVEAELNLGRREDLVTELRVLAARHPLREHLHAQLMLALARGGNQAEALATYHRIHVDLVEELGVEPGDELRSLRARIVAGDLPSVDTRPVVSDADVPWQLPTPPRHFTGRTRELAALAGLLPTARSTCVPIAVIAGTGGIGKTALALRWAHDHADHFPDGQLYANLRGFAPDDARTPVTSVLAEFLNVLGVPPAGVPADVDAQVNLYRSTLAGKRILVVLDNVRDAAQVRRLLPGAAGCMVVVTSRGQLPGLVVINGATPLALELLTPVESRGLLAARLGSVRVEGERAAIDELIRLCDGLPLALNIIAGRAAMDAERSMAAILDELRDTGQRLSTLAGMDETADPRAVFSWSYDALSATAARAFRLIGLHPGPDLCIASVASLLGVELTTARDVLGELTSANLLTEHVPGRFTCHDLLRVYAVEQLRRYETEPERQAALHRMLDHYLHTARAAFAALFPARAPLDIAAAAPGVVILRPADRDAALAWCEKEQAVLLGIVRKAAALGCTSYAWQLPHFLSNFSLQSSNRDRWTDAQRIALSAVERARDVEGQAHLHRLVAMALTLSGRHSAAATHLTKAAQQFQQLGDLLRQGSVQHDLAYTRNEQGQTEQALVHEREALRLATECGNRPGLATALNAVGWYELLLGNHEEALRLCLRALAVFDELDDPQGKAATYDSIGYANHRLGRHDQALDWYRRALPLFDQIGQRLDRADTLVRIGDTCDTVGDTTAARQAWAEALTILESQHHPAAERVHAKLKG